MNELIQKLAVERTVIEYIRARIETAKFRLAETDEGRFLANLEISLSVIRTAATDMEDAIRAEALAVYAADGNKRPHAAISIKEFKVMEYDPKVAVTYCLTHLPGALKLNPTIFEKIAKVVQPDFVTERTEARAQIAMDLSAYMDVAEVVDGTDDCPYACDGCLAVLERDGECGTAELYTCTVKDPSKSEVAEVAGAT